MVAESANLLTADEEEEDEEDDVVVVAAAVVVVVDAAAAGSVVVVFDDAAADDVVVVVVAVVEASGLVSPVLVASEELDERTLLDTEVSVPDVGTVEPGFSRSQQKKKQRQTHPQRTEKLTC